MPHLSEQPPLPDPVLPLVTEAVYAQQQHSLGLHPERVDIQARRCLERRDPILSRWINKNASTYWMESDVSIGHFAIGQSARVYDLLFRQSIAIESESIRMGQMPGPEYQQDILVKNGPSLPVLAPGPGLQEAVERSRLAGVAAIQCSMDVYVGRLILEGPSAPSEAHQTAGQQLATYTYGLLKAYVSLPRQARPRR